MTREFEFYVLQAQSELATCCKKKKCCKKYKKKGYYCKKCPKA